jgi:PAS domain S-box-containing protein
LSLRSVYYCEGPVTVTTGRSEPLLQTSLLGEAIEHAPAAVFVFDDQGRYVAVNRYACDLLGYPRRELLELRLGDLAVARDDSIELYNAVVSMEEPEGVVRVRRSDGEELDLRFRARETTIGGMNFYIAIAWPERPSRD